MIPPTDSLRDGPERIRAPGQERFGLCGCVCAVVGLPTTAGVAYSLHVIGYTHVLSPRVSGRGQTPFDRGLDDVSDAPTGSLVGFVGTIEIHAPVQSGGGPGRCRRGPCRRSGVSDVR